MDGYEIKRQSDFFRKQLTATSLSDQHGNGNASSLQPQLDADSARCTAMQESISRLEAIVRLAPMDSEASRSAVMAGSYGMTSITTDWDIQGRAGRAHTRALGGRLPQPPPRPSVAASVATREAMATSHSMVEAKDKMILVDSAEMEAADLSFEPVIEGVLHACRPNDETFKPLYLAYASTILRAHKGNKTSDPFNTYQILYCNLETNVEEKKEERKNAALTIESDSTVFSFTLYTSDSYFRCRGTREEAKRWSRVLQADIRSYFSEDEWKRKNATAIELRSELAKYFDFELRRYTQLMYAMSAAGILDNKLTVAQQLRGSLELIEEGGRGWRELYCQLTDTCFLSFKSSKGKEPVDAIILKYATLAIDEAFIKDGRYVITITTPLGAYYIRAKHLTSLSEWILAADKILRISPTFVNATEVLKRVQATQTDLGSIERVLLSSAGLASFIEWLKDPVLSAHVLLWRDIQYYLRMFHTALIPAGEHSQRVLRQHITDKIKVYRRPANGASAPSAAGPSSGSLAKKTASPPSSPSPSAASGAPTPQSLATLPLTISQDFALESGVDDARLTALQLSSLHHVQHMIVAELQAACFTAFMQSPQYLAVMTKAKKLADKSNVGVEHQVGPVPAETKREEKKVVASSAPPSSTAAAPSTPRSAATAIAAAATAPPSNDDDDFDPRAAAAATAAKQADAKQAAPYIFDPHKAKLEVQWKKRRKKDEKHKPNKLKYKYIPFNSPKRELTIGRAATSDISVNDSGISRLHARLQWDASELSYVDLGSRYGSKLNGATVTRSRLKVGDTLALGKAVNITIVALDEPEKQSESTKRCIIQ